MTTWIINSDQSLQQFLGDIREQYGKHRFLKVNARVGKDRSIPQNAIGHVWYEQLARELREDDAAGHKRFCKLHFGVPILRAEDEQFREFYNAALLDRTYEQKLQAMSFVPVTSIMTKEQESKYLEAVQEYFLGRGVRLEFPT